MPVDIVLLPLATSSTFVAAIFDITKEGQS